MNPRVLLDGRPAQGRPRGMGVYVLRLAAALAGLGEKKIDLILALDKKQGDDPWPQLENVEKIWGGSLNPVHWEQSVFPGLAVQNHADLLHAPANSSAWGSKIPKILTLHDAIFMRGFWSISGAFYPRQLAAHCYYRLVTALAAKQARLVLTDSEHSRTELVHKLKLDPGKLRVIPLADPCRIQPFSETTVHERLDAMQILRPYVLGFGAIDLRKNTENLVRAFARLPRSAAEMMVLAGFEKAQYSKVPKLIASLGIRNRVKILEYVSESDLTTLFQGASAFAYPSRMEGFGLPILQAFHLGVPVVATRVGSIPEVAGSACRYADPEDPRSISEEILAVLTDPDEAHHLALAGYLQTKQFSWERTAGLTQAAYLEALGLPA